MKAKFSFDVAVCGSRKSMNPNKKRLIKRVNFDGLNFLPAIGYKLLSATADSTILHFTFYILISNRQVCILFPSAAMVHSVFPHFEVFEVNTGASGHAGQRLINSYDFKTRGVGQDFIHFPQQRPAAAKMHTVID